MPWSWLDITLPILVTVFSWWFGTGLVFLAVRGPRHRHARRLAWISLGALAALAALWLLRERADLLGVYAAFAAALLIWGWQEAAFLMGFVTGPKGVRGRSRQGIRHFADAATAIIYHELAIAVVGVILIVMLWGAANETGLWTYLVLWLMRLSAKLNIFLGVYNLSEELLPDHLRFLQPYFCKRPINALFPISITVPTVIAGAMFGHIWFALPNPAEMVGIAIVGTLLALAILEHWFLILPVPDTLLWRWALKPKPDSRQPRASGPARAGVS